MKNASGTRVVLSATAQNLLRITIASYFLAGAIGLIPGSSLLPLTARVLPPELAGPVATFSVFGLSYLVMIGVWLRGAALTLGLLTFWASYLRMLELGLDEDLGTFWRDLALIAALMLTYAETDSESVRRRSIVRRPRPRRIHPRRLGDENGARGDAKETEKLSIEEMERLFHEDFENARSG
ncbi:hypothetical protein [Tropicimonas sp. IMCC6043]|uniref:hypothetical protein n=1 Tax=Tropicimonas sp. IMCC6043 TaxID=2510645 RepID=UPI00101BF26F|nr:hypothetical protein [Tropicimonas sp. IMCC6043]RYH12082.1 hypothetical protein EU800_00505 [Tropicimonas sp. IMCC6043]